ncbi:MAG: hypothetical protein JW735_06945, partial [Prolixibacteraceae bacterium]|nr:hypothetical protein [Prolixibacteraceae bacterium]
MVSFSRFLFASGLSQNEQTSTSIIPFDKFLGVNAFVNDPLDKMQCVGFIREYHNWNWDEGDIWDEGGNTNYPGYPNNEIKWAPSEAGGGAWNFDDFYTNTVNGGITVAPCLKETAKWLRPDFSIGLHDKPTDNAGASTTDPNSYQAKAHHMYQFAARYGSTAVPDDKLTLAPGQPRNTAMGLISYVEDWNEQDKNWEGAAAYFSPQEYAAMASANYDGHANTMTQGSGTFGVKNADPNMKFVMGGIWEINIDYIDAMKTWFAENRADGKFACDVINVHNYSWDGNGPALSPEAFDFEGKMKAVVDYRDQNLNPEIEVWISEFGWDTHPGSRLRPKVTAPFDIYEVQAQWLVRAYLAFAAAGVDRAQQYMLRDVNPESSTQFSTSGMITRYGEWNPKTSWYYVYTLKNTLTNMRFAGKSTTGNENVYAYQFKDID